MNTISKYIKYWYVPFIIIGVFLLGRSCSKDNSQEIKDLKKEIAHRSKIIEGAENVIQTLKLDLRVVNAEKEQAQRGYKKLKAEFDNFKPKEKIKTITVEKIKYVEKIEYDKLYDFSKEIKEKFSLYLKLDKDANWNVEKIITGFENIIKEKDGIINAQKRIISLKKVPRKWGLYFGFGYTSSEHFAFNVSIGYRIC